MRYHSSPRYRNREPTRAFRRAARLLSRSDFRVPPSQSLSSASKNVLGPVPSRERGMKCNSVLFASVFTVPPSPPLICEEDYWRDSGFPTCPFLLFRPQHAALLHDKSLHVSLVRNVQQSRRDYPELHPGNIRRGRLHPNTEYAVRRHPKECQV
ncbi:hypothetical protein BJY52DRAFT_896100 [Lactarius psammicola]|nr:hypothetical protein BJY52DRAFT_896100 [Lactarius psammicola]